MKTAAQTDRGLVRGTNEDAYIIGDFGAAVADGMGGHEAGEVASQTAVSELEGLLSTLPSRPKAALQKVFSLANAAVLQKAREIGREGMGTTLTTVLVGDRQAWIGHIGDSRAYLCRDRQLIQLTQDHSLVADLVRSGSLTPDEAKNHPRRHVITKAIGSQPTVKPDVVNVELAPGDRLVLCTDGLTNQVEPGRLAELAAADDPETACRNLVAAAKASGGLDNITVVIVEVDIDRLPKPKTAWRRWLVLLGVVALLGSAGALARWRLERTYYLNSTEKRVAIGRGLPGNILGFELGRRERITSIRADRLPAYYRKRISAGLVVGDRRRLRAVLSDLRQLAGESRL